MSTIDQDFVEYIVKSLVENPDDVSIERIVDEKGVLLTLSVHDDDLGRVIGKRGATAQSIRTLLRALGTKEEARYNLKIADNGTPPPPRSDDRDDTQDAPSGGSWGGDDSSDDSGSDDADAPADEPAEESAVDKAKKELADLDDLDI